MRLVSRLPANSPHNTIEAVDEVTWKVIIVAPACTEKLVINTDFIHSRRRKAPRESELVALVVSEAREELIPTFLKRTFTLPRGSSSKCRSRYLNLALTTSSPRRR